MPNTSNPHVAITGAAGLLGQHLLRRLPATDVAAIDEPVVRHGRVHVLDLTEANLVPILEGVDTVVHLAGAHDALPDTDLMARVNVHGTRALLEAAERAGVRKVVLASSAAVYGAWPNNPVPLTEDAPLRPNPGYHLAVQKAEAERLLAEWANANSGRVATILRPACVLGPGASHAMARLVRNGLPVGVSGSGAPVQFVHEEDVGDALALAVTTDLPGAYNVSAEGWLAREAFDALSGRRLRLSLPPEVAERALRRLWPAGMVKIPPGILPYALHPWVVAVDRLRAAGWAPRYSNEEAVLATVWPRSVAPLAGGAAFAGGLAVAGALGRRRRRG